MNIDKPQHRAALALVLLGAAGMIVSAERDPMWIPGIVVGMLVWLGASAWTMHLTFRGTEDG